MTERYQDGSYLESNPTWHGEDSSWKAGQVLEMIRRNGLRPRRICEVGSGAGGILLALQASLPDDVVLEGWEISPQAHELAAPRANDRLSFHLGDFLESDGSYDLVLLIDVVEHVEDNFSFMRRLRGRGEHTLVHVPLALSASAALRAERLGEAWDDVGHVHVYNRGLLERFVADVGYEMVDSFYTWGGLDHPRRLLSRLAWLPRAVLARLSPDLAARTIGGASLMALLR